MRIPLLPYKARSSTETGRNSPNASIPLTTNENAVPSTPCSLDATSPCSTATSTETASIRSRLSKKEFLIERNSIHLNVLDLATLPVAEAIDSVNGSNGKKQGDKGESHAQKPTTKGLSEKLKSLQKLTQDKTDTRDKRAGESSKDGPALFFSAAKLLSQTEFRTEESQSASSKISDKERRGMYEMSTLKRGISNDAAEDSEESGWVTCRTRILNSRDTAEAQESSSKNIIIKNPRNVWIDKVGLSTRDQDGRNVADSSASAHAPTTIVSKRASTRHESIASIDTSLASQPTPPSSTTSGPKSAIRRATQSLVAPFRHVRTSVEFRSQEPPDTWWKHFYGRVPKTPYREVQIGGSSTSREAVAGSVSLVWRPPVTSQTLIPPIPIRGIDVDGESQEQSGTTTVRSRPSVRNLSERFRRRKKAVERREQLRKLEKPWIRDFRRLMKGVATFFIVVVSTCCCGWRFFGFLGQANEKSSVDRTLNT